MAKDQMDIQWVDIASVRPYEKNAKKHPKDQVAHIVTSPPVCADSGGNSRLLWIPMESLSWDTGGILRLRA